ncbi:unnamed protein product [Ostreobium quekettii]|uniref:R3H domain-containing protein n=1 Tax=Ostreobium quekettii TaxID=121088 RepID=A0A8S1INL8_9CHLO|nr:unnamed protein product [Ostreobium quekettii]
MHAPEFVEIILEKTPDGPFSLEGCPAEVDSNQDPIVLHVAYTREVETMRRVLQWFHTESSRISEEFPDGDTGASLTLPSFLSKQDRAAWHHIAADLKLGSMSEGTGEDRHLKIFTASHKATGSCELDLTEDQLKEVKKIWKWCQMERGRFASISQQEIGQMMLSPNGLSEELRSLQSKLEQARQVAQYLQLGDMNGASQLFGKNRDLVWCRDEITGGYPIHLACWHGMTDLVDWLAQFQGMVKVTDASYATPVDVARAKGYTDIVDILVQYGAPSEENGRLKSMPHLQRPRYNSFKSDEHRDMAVRLNNRGGESTRSESGRSERSKQVNSDGSYYNDEAGRYEWKDPTTAEVYVWLGGKYVLEAQVQNVTGEQASTTDGDHTAANRQVSFTASNRAESEQNSCAESGTTSTEASAAGASSAEGGAKPVWNEAKHEWEYPGFPGWRWNEVTQQWEESAGSQPQVPDAGSSRDAAAASTQNVVEKNVGAGADLLHIPNATVGDVGECGAAGASAEVHSVASGASEGAAGCAGDDQHGCTWDATLKRWVKDGWSYNNESKAWERL